MTPPMPTTRRHRGTRPLWPALCLLLAMLLPLAGAPAAALAQDAAPEEEFLSIRQDERIYQLDEIAALISRSLNKISDRVSTLAVNSIYFGTEVDRDFRRKAEVVIYEQLLKKNPTVKLVQCQECQRLETKIVRGVLKLRKGIPTQDARIELAKKLSVDGFIDIGVFQDGRQLTLYIKVVEAENGAVIFVDELAGRRAPKRDALTVTFGEINFPIDIAGTTTVHNTLAIGVQESVQLTGRFSFGVDLAVFLDNNDLNPDPHVTISSGLMLSPTLGFDLVQIPASTSRLMGYVGLGKLLAPQLNYANFMKAGVEFVVGDRLVVLIGMINFVESQVDLEVSEITPATTGATSAELKGSSYEIRFGYRF